MELNPHQFQSSTMFIVLYKIKRENNQLQELVGFFFYSHPKLKQLYNTPFPSHLGD